VYFNDVPGEQVDSRATLPETIMRRWLNRILTPPLMFVAALILFVEEILWEAAKRLMAQLGRLPLIHWLEAAIVRLPPYGAAAVFLLPGTLLLPVKIGALWLIAHGYTLIGLQLIIAAKLLGTALVARIFTLARPALMTLAWFAWAYTWVMAWRARIYGFVKASRAWHTVMRWRARMRAWFSRLKPGRIGQRLRAIRRLRKRWAAR
jgi:hypothetical protein